ncbi:unnamed protein product [Meganyctiphanes norvegica]|uniref:Protein kinase domain-containing protein n=1 Tax=Meganyctiphanes norvegica TaxID=48144 RepID=A0AAV2PQP1_MEGNR
MLGSGYFGTVYKAVWTAERRSINVAVKTFNLNTPKIQDEFKSECSSMRKLRHPCLVRLYGTCTKNKLMIVMEMLEKGDLKTYLETDNVNRTEVYQLLKFCYQISCGMAYLESQGIAHRDLAARNILLDDERNIKIADFGLSRMLLGGTYRGKSNIFPTKWTAIEYFEKKIYTMKCDVWSYGVLIWEIFSFGKEPYEELEGSAAIQNFLKNENRLSKPEDCPDVIHRVVMKVCWMKDPDERPSFTDIKETLREHTERFYVNTTVA